jgi:hypothetical protein
MSDDLNVINTIRGMLNDQTDQFNKRIDRMEDRIADDISEINTKLNTHSEKIAKIEEKIEPKRVFSASNLWKYGQVAFYIFIFAYMMGSGTPATKSLDKTLQVVTNTEIPRINKPLVDDTSVKKYGK